MTLILRLSPVALVSEIRGWWIKGRLRRDESVLLEARFADPTLLHIPLYPDVPLAYLGLFSRGRHFFEYQDGWLDRVPDPRILEDVTLIAHALRGYNHYAFLRSVNDEAIRYRAVTTQQPGQLGLRVVGGRGTYSSVSGGPPRRGSS